MTQRWLQEPLAASSTLRQYSAADPCRPQVEAFIQRIYANRFEAQVKAFAPVLVGLHDRDGALVAAAGYRAAHTGTLFLERYLSQPVEALLYGANATPGHRDGIVEVGHLASDRAGEGRRSIRRAEGGGRRYARREDPDHPGRVDYGREVGREPFGSRNT